MIGEWIYCAASVLNTSGGESSVCYAVYIRRSECIRGIIIGQAGESPPSRTTSVKFRRGIDTLCHMSA